MAEHRTIEGSADRDAEVPATVHGLLRRGARLWPDRELVIFEGPEDGRGPSWTWSDALAEANAAATALRAAGVNAGDRVVILVPNGATWLRAWWGATLLGAVVAPVNPAYRGRLLADVCDRISPRVVVADADTADRLDGVHRDAVLDGDRLVGPPGRITQPAELVGPAEPPRPWDPHCLLLTSGTTGPSKASVTTNAALCHFAAWLVESCGVGPEDVFQADMPWFHLSAFGPVIQMMRVGGRFAVRAAPAMSDYWAGARRSGSTFAVAPGTVAQFLESRPARDDDRDHNMRFMVCSPLPSDPARFVERFGLAGLCTAYGSTEASIPLIQALDTPTRAGSCGRQRPGFQVRLVDEYDREVAPGEIGELVVRSDQPWLMSQGYVGDPTATVRAWRNGWFHTGDALRADTDGYLYFHDRYKDVLRRRGENISSFEVERDVAAFPGVAEVACVAAPGDFGGDDEVKVFVVTDPGVELDPGRLVEFLSDRMAYFMVPRYVEVVEELPKTPSSRVRKHLLRERGNSGATWDRQRAGYHLTRAGLERTGPSGA
ncbi:MAG TPA: AMP-binding protein [Pseudonocardia sp.]|nr:AMP-binding protein [Pseudonocardia sp.]